MAQELGIPFFDGDDYHPEENIAKMNAGKVLNDDDRYPWLQVLNALAKEQIQKNSCVIACSSLKTSYRAILKKDIETQVKFVFLKGDFELIKGRLEQRDHFMPVSLLQSQFETLEEPVEALKTNISLLPKEIVDTIKVELMEKSEFGIIGLGVMGTSLARNLASKNFEISIFNRHIIGKEEDIALSAVKNHKELSNAKPFDDLSSFVGSLQRPRKILLMVNAGKPVDAVIESLISLLSENDVLIDAGNSHFEDTRRRISSLYEKGIHFIGAGVSGGEEGALKGPSIMPSGNEQAYQIVSPFLETIASKDKNGNACCAYIGPEGSGHFIKMVHNGIEYVEMQLLAEVYSILKNSGKGPDEIAKLLETFKSEANSFLLEITIDILRKKEGDAWMLDKVLDRSGNKGTGNWTTVAAAQLGIPNTLIAAALFARYLSSFKEDRVQVSTNYNVMASKLENYDPQKLLSGYQFARLLNHIQGFQLINEASNNYHWSLNLSEIARIWTNGCIIRSELMKDFIIFLKESSNPFFNASIKEQLLAHYPNTKQLVADCIIKGIAIPCLSESVNYFNGLKTANSSANLIQAQRDYFGAHTYQRVDDPSGKPHHTDWKNSQSK